MPSFLTGWRDSPATISYGCPHCGWSTYVHRSGNALAFWAKIRSRVHHHDLEHKAMAFLISMLLVRREIAELDARSKS